MSIFDALARWLEDQGADWVALKMTLEPTLNIGHGELHVILGVMVQLAAAWMMRSSVGRLMPWLAVLCLQLINEANDFGVERWPDFAMQLGESVKDTLLTMLLPSVLLVLARRQPHLFQAQPKGTESRTRAAAARTGPS